MRTRSNAFNDIQLQQAINNCKNGTYLPEDINIVYEALVNQNTVLKPNEMLLLQASEALSEYIAAEPINRELMISVINVTKSNCSNDLKKAYKNVFSELGFNIDYYDNDDLSFMADLADKNNIELQVVGDI
ncbi:hypothetical protein Trichorick_00943 [Candidatus Trichorickettsia mobilis]|uniref:Uncharacterized protein n=1 Tax=Candidatus Trichorickettsia mobilis TaxID=1346319 RepID=A0ABZ0USP3_9RICK|nr:hypothetical protein [Candidatus Trichorickettsia mobilis]WPY01050.1 hypothetical protein Trichorick_00943 [Candidatus Trichorickettsia mobilis]